MPNGKSCDKIINAVIVTPACRNGRRGGLKIHWWQHRAGSSPAAGTTPLAGNWTKNNVSALFLVLFSIKKGDPPNAADSLLLETRYRSIILSGRLTPAAWPHGPLYSPLSPASTIALCILRLLFRRHPATWNAILQNIYSPAC